MNFVIIGLALCSFHIQNSRAQEYKRNPLVIENISTQSDLQNNQNILVNQNHQGECEYIIDANEEPRGRISSPNYPEPYPNGLNCKWTIKAAKGRSVYLAFEDFQVTGTDDCIQDYVAIETKGTSTKKCGHDLPEGVLTDGEDATIQFRTSLNGETCKGFSIQYDSMDVVTSCGEKSSAMEFDFISPAYPDPIRNDSLECEVTIEHSCQTPICQIRLDFLDFELKPPTNGSCQLDQMIVEASTSIPILCGSNSGQHIYAETENRASTKIMILIKNSEIDPSLVYIDQDGIEAVIRLDAKWKLHVTQIPCSCEMDHFQMKAPYGCLQYYQDIRGKIQSFNYNGKELDHSTCYENLCTGVKWTGMLNNLDYQLCIKTIEGHCGIVYEEFALDSFSLSMNISDNVPIPRKNLFGNSECYKDFIVIPKGRTPGDKNNWEHDRFCGQALGNCVEGSVISYSTPFVMRVKTEEINEGKNLEIRNRGFELLYTQLPCSSPYILRNHQRFPEL